MDKPGGTRSTSKAFVEVSRQASARYAGSDYTNDYDERRMSKEKRDGNNGLKETRARDVSQLVGAEGIYDFVSIAIISIFPLECMHPCSSALFRCFHSLYYAFIHNVHAEVEK